MSQVGTLGLGPQPLTLLLEQAWVLLGNAPEGRVPLCMLMAVGPSSVRTSTCTGGPTCPRRTISSLDTHMDAKGLSSPLSRSLAETQNGSWQTADLGFALSLSLHLSCPLGHFICM